MAIKRTTRLRGRNRRVKETYTLAPDILTELDVVRVALHASTKTEAVRRAIMIVRGIVRNTMTGGTVAVIPQGAALPSGSIVLDVPVDYHSAVPAVPVEDSCPLAQ